MNVQVFTTTLGVFACGECHMSFGMTEAFERARRRDHGTFYCPAGHSMAWSERSDLEMVQQARDNALQRAQQLRNLLDDEQAQHRRTEHRLRSTRGVVTKIKQRIVAGACPKCHARFPDLRDHMASEHPNYG